MTERPTPVEVIEVALESEADYGTIDRHARGIVARLDAHGYQIVHYRSGPTLPGGYLAIRADLLSPAEWNSLWPRAHRTDPTTPEEPTP